MKYAEEQYRAKKQKWHQEPRFRSALKISNLIFIALMIGISIVDQQLYVTGLWIIVGLNVLIVGATYLFRNNP